MKEEITVYYKRKKISLPIYRCNFLQMGIGLMFSRREKAKNLLFDFKEKQKIAIHSFFVFYPFLAVWIDKRGKVVELKKVYPFNPCVTPNKATFSLVELPINSKNKKVLSLLDDC